MRTRQGFTLIELVVVVMIIGILVAIAAPKMLNITADANNNATRMSLEVIRDAIETHASQKSGVYPVEATFKVDVQLYLRGPFPKSMVGLKKDAKVAIGTGTPLAADNSTGWMYNVTTGEFIINSTAWSNPPKNTIKYSDF